MDHFLNMLFSIPDQDLGRFLEDQLVFIDESKRVGLFEELMEMVCESFDEEDLVARRIAERAERIADLMNPYNDHQLRGLIRFNTLALSEETDL